jgi:agmatinase
MPDRPVLIGVPYDASSSFLRGAADAPAHIRAALLTSASNPWSERIVASVSPEVLEDAGDLAVPANGENRVVIEDAIRKLVAQDRRVIALGGDHSITYPIVRAVGKAFKGLTILQIDAHPDLYDEYEGDRFSHACPFARILEEELAVRLVQVGIRAMTGHGREQALRFGVEQIDMRAWADGARPGVEGNVYVSIDMDGLDPAFAPGVSHREPGGLTVRDVLTMIDGLTGQLVGADIVEFNPKQDPLGLTAPVAAKFVKELAGKFLEDERP